MKSKELLNEDEQVEAVDEWNARRPTKPEASKPFLKQTDVIFGIALPMTALGFVAGFILLMLGVSNTTGMKEILTNVGFISMLVLPFGLPIAYVVGLMTLEDVRRFIYRRRMAKTGWNEYEESLVLWREEGKSFNEWILNKHVYDSLIKASRDD